MIHAALWILAAFVVIPTVFFFGGLLVLLLGGNRWKYALAFIAIIGLWVVVAVDKQHKASEARVQANTPPTSHTTIV